MIRFSLAVLNIQIVTIRKNYQNRLRWKCWELLDCYEQTRTTRLCKQYASSWLAAMLYQEKLSLDSC